MKDATAVLAESITRAGSKQTYYTIRLMADKDLVNDFYRAYAYFRWIDDIVDDSSKSEKERISFIERQSELIDSLYNDKKPGDLKPEEEMVADLINHDRGDNSGLQSYIRNMFAIIEFDAYRKGRLIGQKELTRYADCLGKAVTDGIQYFVGNGHIYPVADSRYLAATAAHITHLLRDMMVDISEGFINIPREYLEAHDISLEDVDSPAFRCWVRNRVNKAKRYFREGKQYFDQMGVLRCKIVGYWYCARFECVLDAIERDGCILRESYGERRRFPTLVKMVWLTISITFRHIFSHRKVS